MVGADDTTELQQPPLTQSFTFYYFYTKKVYTWAGSQQIVGEEVKAKEIDDDPLQLGIKNFIIFVRKYKK